ncbi:class 1 fructose-bisphosphatase [Silvimonas sp.]|uniref:class 1 fructose-bisphosphatase n=1 Tax=Silvimonas sp. TaxID=2650811 RepID=UPI0028423D10|nr:class 1 fructose-bisphosphatase [Silvimonas sp.]MDR3428971.1 class 1 fructose-bisphosphatase [Silvimonas sp.]
MSTSLSSFIATRCTTDDRHPVAFYQLIHSIAQACRAIAAAVDRSALAGTTGSAGVANVQGEEQKKLDIVTNTLMLEGTANNDVLAAVASEEMARISRTGQARKAGQYLLLFDPLDGSSNVDVNAPVGTIFSILRCADSTYPVSESDFLQPGTAQVCAGYAIYGAATMLVLTLGDGVDGFTLDRDSGEFVLTHPRMTIPASTREFAINTANTRFWEAPVNRYIDECLAGANGPRKQDFNMRWVAAMVADVHRILLRGGVFLYPQDTREASRFGKLRLLYEANPMSFLVEQAGGMSSTGHERVMDIQPHALHQRIAVMLGSRDEVERLTAYHQQAAQPVPDLVNALRHLWTEY